MKQSNLDDCEELGVFGGIMFFNREGKINITRISFRRCKNLSVDILNTFVY